MKPMLGNNENILNMRLEMSVHGIEQVTYNGIENVIEHIRSSTIDFENALREKSNC